MNRAIGWACNLKDIFVRFPFEKLKSLSKLTLTQKKKKVNQVFREGLHCILMDIVENNVTFHTPGMGYQRAEIHFEAIRGEEFKRVRAKGKFADVDFLESIFTGFQLYMYIGGKRDNFLNRRKFPIYLGSTYKDIVTQHTNEGKQYC